MSQEHGPTTASREALWSGAQAVLEIMFLNAVGVVLAWYPRVANSGAAAQGLLDQPTIARLSKLSVVVFLPALVASSLAKRLTLRILADAWMLPVAAAAQVTVGAVAAIAIIRWVARPPPHLRRPFMCAIAFQNSSALPLVIGEALASQPPFSHDPDAFGKLAIYVFLYNIGWQLIFWTVAYSFLTTEVAGGSSSSEPADASSVSQSGNNVTSGGDTSASDASFGGASTFETVLHKSFTSPVLMGTFVGITVGLCRPLHHELYAEGGAMQFVGAGVDTLGQAMVPVVTLVIASTLGKAVLRAMGDRRGIPTPLGYSNTASATASVADNLHSAAASDGTECQTEPLPHMRLLATLCVGRLVVVGGFQFAVTSLLVIPVVFPHADPLLKLALLLECVVPSANMVIVTCQQAGRQRAAEDLSAAYVLQYVLLVPTLLVFIPTSIHVAGV